jgi:putative endonuclease
MTSDLRKRVSEHNRGKVRSTKSRRPLHLAYCEGFSDKTSARKRELFLKSGQGRMFLQTRIRESEEKKHRTQPEVFRRAVSPAEGGSLPAKDWQAGASGGKTGVP